MRSITSSPPLPYSPLPSLSFPVPVNWYFGLQLHRSEKVAPPWIKWKPLAALTAASKEAMQYAFGENFPSCYLLYTTAREISAI